MVLFKLNLYFSIYGINKLNVIIKSAFLPPSKIEKYSSNKNINITSAVLLSLFKIKYIEAKTYLKASIANMGEKAASEVRA